MMAINKTMMAVMTMALLVSAAMSEGARELAVDLGAPFHDNAVLQRQMKLPVWGWSTPGTAVTVELAGQEMSAIAGKNGKWMLWLAPLSASLEPTKIVIREAGGKTETLSNILVGDVWLCAGQSNMAGKMRTSTTRHFPADSIEKADYPALRQMLSPTSEWLVCSPETAPEFKKVAFFFGRRLQRDARVPVGLIVAAVGGSKIETWLNQAPYETGGNYSRLLAPLVGYGLRGALWYQGESNERDYRAYQPKLQSLIGGWRKAWQQGDFPVYYVQLPGIGVSSTDNPAGGDGRAEIRQACFETLAVKNTGMAVTIDIGAKGEHPPNKYDTGVRLARLALRDSYGFDELAICPIYQRYSMEGRTVRISFDNANSGLMVARKEGFLPPTPTPDAKLPWLSIQAKDGSWHWADGEIDGPELLVSCKGVSEPIAVRYAYTQHPNGHLLYNKEGQPVSPFSTNGYGSEALPDSKRLQRK
ncbi:MAG: sialate O-acetylesterase [Rhodothermales bacterium]|jgi:sialate O-acetylesterase